MRAKKSDEYQRFTNLVDMLMSVPHEEIKRREAEYRKQREGKAEEHRHPADARRRYRVHPTFVPGLIDDPEMRGQANHQRRRDQHDAECDEKRRCVDDGGVELLRVHALDDSRLS